MLTFKEFLSETNGFMGQLRIPHHIDKIVLEMSKQIQMMGLHPQPMSLGMGFRYVYVIPKNMQNRLGRGATYPPNQQWLIQASVFVPDPKTKQAIWDDGNIYVDANNLDAIAKQKSMKWRDRQWDHVKDFWNQTGDLGQRLGSELVGAAASTPQLPRYRSYGQ